MASKHYHSWLMLAVLGGNLAGGTSALAQQAAPAEDSATQALRHHFSIPGGGSLAGALLAFGQQSGLQLIAPSELTSGLSSAGVSGSYPADDALRTLLSGTSLGFKYVSTNTIQIYSNAVASTDGTEVLGAVQVDGALDQATAIGGVNGSTDITATEGSGSLNGSMLTVGSKGATSVKDTPQSVSVITSETMQQQGIRTLNDAMQKATGITVQQGKNSREQAFYSRGFQITRASIDGGSPIDITGGTTLNKRFSPSFDMSMYDHVEILRGADDLFNGFSTTGPGGTVNLVRKRPLDHFQLKYDGSAGSWDNYQNSLDLTSPLNDAGTLRARAVLTRKDSHHFYRTAKDEKTVAYGMLEADLTDSTLLTFGGSYQRIRGVPLSNGLTLYSDGSDPHFSRKTAWVFPWEKADSDTREVFAKLDQKIGDRWNFNLNYSGLYQRNSTIYSNVAGDIKPDTGLFSADPIAADGGNSNNKQFSFDSTLTGEFDVFDLPQKLTLGANYSKQSYWMTSPDAESNISSWFGGNGPSMDPWNWDTSVPAPSVPAGYYAYLSSGSSINWGMYSQLVLTPWKPLHFGLGLRLNAYKSNTHTSTAYDQSDTSEFTRKWESPYYSVSYDINDDLSWYGSYTKIFIPQSNMISPSGQQIDPETGSNLETGLKYAEPGGLLNASLSLYQIRLVNQGQLIGDSSVDLGGGRQGYYRNASDADISKGVDLEITGSIQPWWQTSLGYTYNFNKYSTSPDGLNDSISVFTPKHTIKWWNDFQFNDAGETLSKFSFGVGVQAQSKTKQVGTLYDEKTDTIRNYNANTAFYAVYSARIGYAINRNWSVALLGNNLFDKTYYSTIGSTSGGYWYGDPRNFLLSISGTFD
ncbi:TonB-dependent receptor [Erwinia sp. S38]|uniref:TonB-dependent siderophore receptor n=1 Tax=Erwinia sp. S38 TaxID=2769338 RepID=UPI00190C34AA|nr:TonB-dependent receptor [Erwinia sp. S38]MBK0003592.1 TonB-dependent siderophore receptor [Erwinia sp. S38]